MAEHDERDSPHPRRPEDDTAMRRDVNRLADAHHKTSNHVHEQEVMIAVLKQRVEEHHAVVAGLPDRFREIERDAEERERHANEHAAELVKALEERLSAAATRWIAVAAIVSGLVGGLVPVLVSLLTRGKP